MGNPNAGRVSIPREHPPCTTCFLGTQNSCTLLTKSRLPEKRLPAEVWLDKHPSVALQSSSVEPRPAISDCKPPKCWKSLSVDDRTLVDDIYSGWQFADQYHDVRTKLRRRFGLGNKDISNIWTWKQKQRTVAKLASSDWRHSSLDVKHATSSLRTSATGILGGLDSFVLFPTD